MSWNWSTDFTTISGVDFTDLVNGPFPMFVRAYVERERVAFGLDYTVTAAAGDDALWCTAGSPGTAGQLNWGTLQLLVDELATYFVRPGSWVGSSLIKNLRYSDAGNTVIDRTFPQSNGWSRAFPRTIYTLSQPGTAGQRARFEALTGIAPYYGVLSTDPLFGTTVSTPSGEQKNTGKFFVYSGGAWTQSSDQTSPPDVVSEFGILAKPGDYITAQMLNDIRDALNECTVSYRTCAFNSTPGLSTLPWSNLREYLGSPTGDFTPPNDTLGNGTGTSIATADANYSQSSVPFEFTFPAAYGKTSASYSTYNVRDYSTHFAVLGLYKVPYAFQASWYFSAGVYNYSTGGYTFDAQGTTALNLQWQQMGTTSAAANVDFLIGPALPGSSPSPPPNWSNVGWEVADMAGLLNWAVTGGFTYVSGYAGT